MQNAVEYDAICISHTVHNFHTHMKEQKNQSWTEKNVTSSAQHCIKYNHSFNLDNHKILHCTPKSKRLIMLENLETQKVLPTNKMVTNRSGL